MSQNICESIPERIAGRFTEYLGQRISNSLFSRRFLILMYTEKKIVNLTNLGSQYDHDKLTAQKQSTDPKVVILTTIVC